MEKNKSKFIHPIIKDFNPINYYTFWALVWYILYKTNNIKISPFSIFILIFIPSTYILIIYMKYSTDIWFIYLFKIIVSSIAHYVPIIELAKNSNIKLLNVLSMESILLNLILINLYFTYLNYRNLDVNTLYEEIYFTNKYL